MQLAVIDDLITQEKLLLEKYSYSHAEREAKTQYLKGFIDCALKAQVISEADYQSFKAQVEALPCR